LHGVGHGNPDVRTVVHLHDGKTPAESDGYPEAWYPPGKSATYFYPNRQDAATLWYHDHAMGINRLNIYAGLWVFSSSGTALRMNFTCHAAATRFPW
jgi:spore coat protein A, manganese oxidase